MNLSMKYFMTILILMIIIMMVIMMISKKSIMEWQKSTPFECGFNAMALKRLPFSIHFFLIAVIFLIFDIEIIIILPMLLTLSTSMMKTWIITGSMFMIVLTLGLYHEWSNGMLNWTN